VAETRIRGGMTIQRITRLLRGRIGATQRFFALMVHSSQGQVCRWEAGAAEPDCWQETVIRTMWNHGYEEPARLDAAADWVERDAPLRALAVLLEPISARSRAHHVDNK
jgi:hypothetical protein